MLNFLRSRWKFGLGLALLPFFAPTSGAVETGGGSSEPGTLSRWAAKLSLRQCGAACAREIADAVTRESRRFGFEPALLLGVIATESGFVPSKRGTHGEIGLMQIKPRTARWIARHDGMTWGGARTLFNPAVNIRIGAAYLAFLRESFRSHEQLYLAAYNMGAWNVRKALLHGGAWPQQYSSRVQRWSGQFRLIGLSTA